MGGVEGAQMGYAAPPPVVQYEAPGRINVSHELFAKLAAGGALTPEEIAQLEGTMPAVEATVAAVEEAPAPEAAAAGAEVAVDASASPKKSSNKKENGSKKALKASKKKKEKGCC